MNDNNFWDKIEERLRNLRIEPPARGTPMDLALEEIIKKFEDRVLTDSEKP
jgi:hypothetical protein